MESKILDTISDSRALLCLAILILVVVPVVDKSKTFLTKVGSSPLDRIVDIGSGDKLIFDSAIDDRELKLAYSHDLSIRRGAESVPFASPKNNLILSLENVTIEGDMEIPFAEIGESEILLLSPENMSTHSYSKQYLLVFSEQGQMINIPKIGKQVRWVGSIFDHGSWRYELEIYTNISLIEKIYDKVNI